ncbi:hypothetical protein CCP4SC76_1830003 [Gammaproteobacteria bacterium]
MNVRSVEKAKWMLKNLFQDREFLFVMNVLVYAMTLSEIL